MQGGISDDATLAAGQRKPLLSPGSVFAGRYVVERLLGEGGMGTVHAVLDRELGERVALKVLSEIAGARPEALERFRREVRLARRVTHRNAARTFDIGEHEGLHFMTMELVEGQSLAQHLRGQPKLTAARVVEIGQQICEGLTAVHEAGIIHRDLKPANVLLETTGRVVLTDFGIARPTTNEDQLTQDPGQLVGTPHYMAPEQVSGDPLTARTDLFALGLMLYEMATGRLPFVRDTTIATAIARLNEAPEPPDAGAGLPPALVESIMACLHRDPSGRPDSAEAVRTGLAAIPSHDAPTQPPGPSTDPSAQAVDPTLAGGTSATSFCTVNVGERSLAVLPLRYRGPADDAYVAEAITEQLIDLLSMTKGLRVPAAGAVEQFSEHRDPRAVREALGVDAVVDGTVQRSGSRLRATIRLLDAETSYQTWSERFDGELQDVFELQDRIATQVAEALRLRVEKSRLEVSAPPEALELYMRARVLMRDFRLGGPEGAPALLERCLALAPELPPALASYAMACARMWFFFGEDPWQARCEDAVARAQRFGPHLPDTHLATARMHSQRSEFTEAARALQRALELAPTYAAAHIYLGIMQCEAGRAKEGIRHIELGLQLAPTDRMPLLTAARHMLLHGENEQAEALMQRLASEDPEGQQSVQRLKLRAAVWHRDREAIAHLRDQVTMHDNQFGRFVLDRLRFAMGEISHEELLASVEAFVHPDMSRRLRALIDQLLVEALLSGGNTDRAVPVLVRLADEALVDVDWLEHCPLLVPLRDEPWMKTARNKVRTRARAIWAL